MKTYETAREAESFILVGLESDGSLLAIDESLDELEELVKTSGGVSVDRLVQKRERPHPGHYLGKGKLDELSDLISLHNATGIVCDDELTNTQIRNMNDILGVKVVDRTLIILDIFANQASSAEGKAQVELAQQKYRLSHLTGLGKSLSRLGGGIGTRGPGEKKLETDRRHIKRRITELEEELKDIETHRNVQREKRSRNSQIVVSLVGYTNAGKSTLMNALTGAGVFESGKLFATLDTTTRQLELSGGSTILLSDTVGFIQKLPHNLIKAFRSTLDELKYSNIIIHVVDSSNPARSQHMKVVYDTMASLGSIDKPIICALNKCDLETDLPYPMDSHAEKTLFLSAKTGKGTAELLTEIERLINSMRRRLAAVLPYNEGSLMNRVREKSEIICEEYRENGIYVEIYADEEIAGRIKDYIV
ncbi:GTPase HflX [Tyzzerella sp. OttesenSCG-928-J15]|nr:GTPase HflX [Tyzzerella sp. OttesenSCG-928-J15]